MQAINHTSKYDTIEIFVEALNEFQRRSTSLSSLNAAQYRELMQNVERLGGWKSVLALLSQKNSQVPPRVTPFKKQRQKLFTKDSRSKKISKRK